MNIQVHLFEPSCMQSFAFYMVIYPPPPLLPCLCFCFGVLMSWSRLSVLGPATAQRGWEPSPGGNELMSDARQGKHLRSSCKHSLCLVRQISRCLNFSCATGETEAHSNDRTCLIPASSMPPADPGGGHDPGLGWHMVAPTSFQQVPGGVGTDV